MNELIEAIKANDLAQVNRLIEIGVNPAAILSEDEICIPIEIAAYNGHLEIVNRLLEDSRVEPRVRNCIPVRSAIVKNRVDVLCRLMVDSRVYEAVQNRCIDFTLRAIYWEQIDVLDKLLEYDFKDPSIYGNQIIDYAFIRYNKSHTQAMVKIIDHIFRDPRVYSTFVISENSDITKISMILTRFSDVCITLQDLNLPAFVTLQIMDSLIINNIPMHKKWEVITKVKHFRIHPNYR